MYPPEDIEGCFGVHMDYGVGAVVFNSWKTLFLRGKITEANVKRAIAGGNLPAFFEETVYCRTAHLAASPRAGND